MRLFRALWCRLKIMVLVIDIKAADAYAEQCRNGGVMTPRQLRNFRAAVTPKRVKLALLEAQRDRSRARPRGTAIDASRDTRTAEPPPTSASAAHAATEVGVAEESGYPAPPASPSKTPLIAIAVALTALAFLVIRRS